MADLKSTKNAPDMGTISNEEVELRKQLRDLEKENKKLKEEAQAVTQEEVKESKVETPVLPVEVQTILENLRSEINTLKGQVAFGAVGDGKKPKFRPITPADWQEEMITFNARSVLYIAASYINSKGMEVLPPHKLIVFEYTASDIRKDGREEEVINFCHYTTNLKSEIEFLRGHPHYNISFSENTHEVLKGDLWDTQYKIRAASMVSALSPETIYERAKSYGIAYHSMSMEEIKARIINEMAAEAKKDKATRNSELAKRIAVGMDYLTHK